MRIFNLPNDRCHSHSDRYRSQMSEQRVNDALSMDEVVREVVVDFDWQEIVQQIQVLEEQLNAAAVVVVHEFFVLIFPVVALVCLRKCQCEEK